MGTVRFEVKVVAEICTWRPGRRRMDLTTPPDRGTGAGIRSEVGGGDTVGAGYDRTSGLRYASGGGAWVVAGTTPAAGAGAGARGPLSGSACACAGRFASSPGYGWESWRGRFSFDTAFASAGGAGRLVGLELGSAGNADFFSGAAAGACGRGLVVFAMRLIAGRLAGSAGAAGASGPAESVRLAICISLKTFATGESSEKWAKNGVGGRTLRLGALKQELCV